MSKDAHWLCKIKLEKNLKPKLKKKILKLDQKHPKLGPWRVVHDVGNDGGIVVGPGRLFRLVRVEVFVGGAFSLD